MTNFDDFAAEAQAEDESQMKRLEKKTRIDGEDELIPVDDYSSPELPPAPVFEPELMAKCPDCGFEALEDHLDAHHGNAISTNDALRGYCSNCGTQLEVDLTQYPELGGSTKRTPHGSLPNRTTTTGFRTEKIQIVGEDEILVSPVGSKLASVRTKVEKMPSGKREDQVWRDVKDFEHLVGVDSNVKRKREEARRENRRKRNAVEVLDPRPWKNGQIVSRRALQAWCDRNKSATEIEVNTGRGKEKVSNVAEIIRKCRSILGIEEKEKDSEPDCEWCNGDGFVLGDPRRVCKRCNGNGKGVAR